MRAPASVVTKGFFGDNFLFHAFFGAGPLRRECFDWSSDDVHFSVSKSKGAELDAVLELFVDVLDVVVEVEGALAVVVAVFVEAKLTTDFGVVDVGLGALAEIDAVDALSVVIGAHVTAFLADVDAVEEVGSFFAGLTITGIEGRA